MPGFRNLFFSSLAFLALLALAGCGTETEPVEERSGPASPEVHDAIGRLTGGDADAAAAADDADGGGGGGGAAADGDGTLMLCRPGALGT